MRKLLFSLTAFLFSVGTLLAQKVITGKVTDDKGNPVPNATVTVKGASLGTTTKSDGTYSLTVPENATALVFSSVDFIPEEVSIGSQTVINPTIRFEDKTLSEVVVVGYQTVKRSEVTGSIANISGSDLAQKPGIISLPNLLQGKATGVQVTGQSGRPGAAGYIRVRGTGSINASNEPLFIMDGVPISAVAYNMLNPNDIEDITVLKDAASQAIYGSRAANGVIVITSKKGKGKAQLNYSFTFGKAKTQDLKNLTLMNSRQKMEYEYGGKFTNPYLDTMIGNRVGSGVFPANSTLFSISAAQREELWNLLESRGPGDWTDYLLQDGDLMSHELSVSGGSDKLKYYFSLNRSDNDGVSYGSYWNKTGGRLNVEYNALDWFKMGTNIGVTHSKESNVRSLYNTQSAYTTLFLTNAYEPVYLNNGKYNLTHSGYSPLEGTDFNPSVLDRISTFATVFGEANFFKYLTLKTQLGINYNTLSQENYLKPGSNLASILGYNQKSDAGNRDFLYVITNTANWRQTLADKHSINILLGQEFTKNKFYSYSLAARGLPTASVNTQDNAGAAQTATTSRSDWSLVSYFGNATYDFEKKYYLTVSGRRDGSSRFGANKRFANFWAVGATWDVLKENFMQSVNFISALKLRTSVGTAGTVPTGNYDNLGVYSLTTKYSDLPTAVPARLANPDLTWETNKNYDIGIDLGFLRNRINITADYYNRKTDDLIYPRNVSVTTGFASFTSNIGNMENKGFEVAIDGDVIRNKDLTVNLFASYSTNDNKITKLYSDNVPQNLSRFKEGEEAYTYFLVRWAGINPANGKNLYYTKDGALTETYLSSDAVLLKGKSPLAKFFGSFGANITYKGFDFSTQFYYTGGNYIMNYMYAIGASEGEGIADQQFTVAADYWKKPGDIVKYANLNDLSQRVTFDSDKYLEKGDFVSLRDITIAYTTPSALAQKIKLKSLRFFVQGTNLWIGTKFKGIPEVGEPNGETTFNPNGNFAAPGLYNLFAQPQLKALTFGIDVRF